ncbi:hypothetical protein Aph02nite_58940 [Actinoplanes philippinensis]|uniref:Uncharacterized protein n=1 Tax=Actinoplanes philippinensis TaxID=35752 RepID=A0A1I2JEL5_9ACTN|nr:hypothetical protein Aph02nite_58940 [Actinoplanes philippinensis]SFF52293.1 hypothetical protein SAMN05421541_112103 [Actinoplanes philippinensis]
MLYGLTALILTVGVGWWWRAAPRQAPADRLADWRHSAEQLLPDTGDQELADTLALDGEGGHEEVVDVEEGAFRIAVVCAGADGSRVRVGIGESGRGLRCSGSRTPEIFSVGLSTRLRLQVAVESPGPVVFRYALQRSPA